MNTCNLLPRPRWIRHVGHNLEQRKETKLLSLSAPNNITSLSSLAVRFMRNRIEKKKLLNFKSFSRRKHWSQFKSAQFFLVFSNTDISARSANFSTLPKTKTMGSSTCSYEFLTFHMGPRTAGNQLNTNKFHEKGRWKHINYEDGWVVTKS